MNQITVTGRIVAQANITTKGDVVLAKTTIASDRSRGKNSATDFLEIVAFGDTAGQLAELGKGEFVRLTGSLRTGAYDAKDGSRRKSATIAVRKVERYQREVAA